MDIGLYHKILGSSISNKVWMSDNWVNNYLTIAEQIEIGGASIALCLYGCSLIKLI